MADFSGDDEWTARVRVQNREPSEEIKVHMQIYGDTKMAEQFMRNPPPYAQVPALLKQIAAKIDQVNDANADLQMAVRVMIDTTADPNADAQYMVDLAGKAQTAAYTLGNVSTSLDELVGKGNVPMTEADLPGGEGIQAAAGRA